MNYKRATGIPEQYLELLELFNKQDVEFLEHNYYLMRDMPDMDRIKFIDFLTMEIRCIIESKQDGFTEIK